MRKLKYILNDLRFLKALNSPFKPFKLKFYAGKIAIGTPYFYPRKWVNLTKQEIFDKAQERYKKLKIEDIKNVIPTIEHYKKLYKNTQKAIPKKIGFDFVGLGYKTKWTDTDYRYEYGPIFSFVFFGYQIALMIGNENPDNYWEAWLYYEHNTDKTKSKAERIKQCREEFPQTWTRYSGDKKETIDYYNLILKKKYLK